MEEEEVQLRRGMLVDGEDGSMSLPWGWGRERWHCPIPHMDHFKDEYVAELHEEVCLSRLYIGLVCLSIGLFCHYVSLFCPYTGHYSSQSLPTGTPGGSQEMAGLVRCVHVSSSSYDMYPPPHMTCILLLI